MSEETNNQTGGIIEKIERELSKYFWNSERDASVIIMHPATWERLAFEARIPLEVKVMTRLLHYKGYRVIRSLDIEKDVVEVF